ncbi:hypothetical protein GE061_003732 [Apolygus lucorum]|uniref:G-protein coupled receptors family 1 profile domain-containing protein n=1 Tax=Apolygus lucorum TaxID=248454 RepID=A0A8S9X493_APOLU|nr:hypothetical protein GE061_003732 [Apolygus lucorum]
MSRFWEYRLVERTGSLGGQIITYYNSENTELVRNELYVKLKRYWLFIILDFLLPLASIIVLNAVTFFKLKKMNSKRRIMTDSSESDDKLTKMMLYVILEFFVLTSLTGFVNIASMFPTDFSRYVYTMPGSGYFATQVKLILDSLNSSVNLVTYFTSWPPFRKAFLKMFCCQEARNQFSPPSPRNPVKASNTKTTPF